MNLEKIVTDFLHREQLTKRNIGVAVSGGIDSTVLLHLITKCGNPERIFVLHVHHGTRSACDTEWNLVEEMCKTYHTHFLGKKLTSVPQKNQEASWRKERKIFFEKCVKSHNFKKILTGHHATDLVETMIWRLTKGCGISGLAPFDITTKPLWNVPRNEIEKYAHENNLSWCEDESNLNTNFERNLIRQNVLPNLRKITPNLEQVFIRESKIFHDASIFIEKNLPKIEPIELKKFLELDATIQTEFLRRISKKTPSASEVKDCLRWIHGNPKGGSQKILGGTKIVYKDKFLNWEQFAIKP
jgi:tRNA(Ile)-lysidine synthase